VQLDSITVNRSQLNLAPGTLKNTILDTGSTAISLTTSAQNAFIAEVRKSGIL
jgi:hypothetical protein